MRSRYIDRGQWFLNAPGNEPCDSLNPTLADYCLVGTNICNTAVVVQRAVLYGWSDSASRPAVYVFIQSAGSMRSPSFHFAMRSKRANKPTPGDPRVHSGTDASSVIKSPSFGPLGVIT